MNDRITTLAAVAKDQETADLIELITRRINAELSWPGSNEAEEARVIRTAITKVANVLPPLVLRTISSAEHFLSAGRRELAVELLVSFLNERVDIPWLPERFEAALLRPIVEQIIAFAEEGLDITAEPEEDAVIDQHMRLR